MNILTLIFIVAILVALMLVIFKTLAKAAEQNEETKDKPIRKLFIRYWWLVPIVFIVLSFTL